MPGAEKQCQVARKSIGGLPLPFLSRQQKLNVAVILGDRRYELRDQLLPCRKIEVRHWQRREILRLRNEPRVLAYRVGLSRVIDDADAQNI